MSHTGSHTCSHTGSHTGSHTYSHTCSHTGSHTGSHTVDVGLIQLSFIPVCSPTVIHATFQSNCAEGLHFSAFHCIRISMSIAGLYTGFLPRGGELGVCQKERGEAVRSCRAATGGWVQEGDVPLPHKMFTYLRSIYMSCDML